jgi:hypothetical protein
VIGRFATTKLSHWSSEMGKSAKAAERASLPVARMNDDGLYRKLVHDILTFTMRCFDYFMTLNQLSLLTFNALKVNLQCN